MIAFKAGVDLTGLRAELAIALVIVGDAFRDLGVPCVVTAIKDGRHMQGSLHYSGAACDLRLGSRYTNSQETDHKLLAALAERLGPQFDVLLESDHFHIEFDPK